MSSILSQQSSYVLLNSLSLQTVALPQYNKVFVIIKFMNVVKHIQFLCDEESSVTLSIHETVHMLPQNTYDLF